ncbi:MAG TPA: hypothetical protein VHD62_00120 [Opitutaceae bacterium]|nr:hypothetical protein [Opitutaceae bacterium]
MKKLFLLFALTAAALCGQPATLDLGSHGQLTLYFPEGWKVTSTNMAGQATLTATPAGDANATCTLQVSFPEQDRFDTKSRLKTRVEADGYPIAENSVEGKAIAHEFSLTSGFGFYCSFTDAELRGKPATKGEFKVMSLGKIHLAPDVLIDVQIMADAFRDKAYQELLGAIEGMEFKAGSG